MHALAQVEAEIIALEEQQQEHERELAAQLISVHDRHLRDMYCHEQMLLRKLQDCNTLLDRAKCRRMKLW